MAKSGAAVQRAKAKASGAKTAAKSAARKSVDAQLSLAFDKDDPTAVDARPTKRFFISVITRDITLTRAILDLIDNAVDAAARVRGAPVPGVLTPTEQTRYRDLWIKVKCSESEFEITDNCFGMPLDVARFYAFRFGHDDSAFEKKHRPKGQSRIGQFGIGMKRGLFKIGNEFRVNSVTEKTEFILVESVETWLKRPAWDFHFESFIEKRPASSKTPVGTSIRITSLNDGVKEEFSDKAFVTGLAREVGEALQEYTRRGLVIEIGSDKATAAVPKPDPALYSGEGIQPVKIEQTVNGSKDGAVKIRLFCGIGPRNYKHAGWNVFCNGRLVVAQDKTKLTGWGVADPVRIPRYHKQFDRFYGYVYFDSDQLQRLPWNTTKTGVDEESPLYLGVRDKMIEHMKPVIDLLNEVRTEEKAGPGVSRAVLPVMEKLDAAGTKPLEDLESASVFVWPRPTVKSMPQKQSNIIVSFERPADELKVARKYFNVESNDDAAMKAFLYWLSDTRRGSR